MGDPVGPPARCASRDAARRRHAGHARRGRRAPTRSVRRRRPVARMRSGSTDDDPDDRRPAGHAPVRRPRRGRPRLLHGRQRGAARRLAVRRRPARRRHDRRRHRDRRLRDRLAAPPAGRRLGLGSLRPATDARVRGAAVRRRPRPAPRRRFAAPVRRRPGDARRGRGVLLRRDARRGERPCAAGPERRGVQPRLARAVHRAGARAADRRDGPRLVRLRRGLDRGCRAHDRRGGPVARWCPRRPRPCSPPRPARRSGSGSGCSTRRASSRACSCSSGRGGWRATSPSCRSMRRRSACPARRCR